MLPQRHRLRDRSVFQTLYKQGQRTRGRWLTVLCLPRRNRKRSKGAIAPVDLSVRWAIVVSKKVSRRAVDRNRIRRRIRAALEQLESRWQSGWDVVVIVKPTPQGRDRPLLLDCPFAEVRQEVEALMSKSGVLETLDAKARS